MKEPKSAAEIIESDEDMRKLVARRARRQHRAQDSEAADRRLTSLERTADLFRELGRGVPSHIIDLIAQARRPS